MSSTPFKICLIVDNPTRDLDGLVLLARLLANDDAEVFLIPMYSQGHEVPSICPDFVLMNYARKANTDLIRAYSDAGISVGVLDTEGGIWESDEQFIRSIDHDGSADYIDLYCLWGTRQYDAMLKHTAFTENRLALTGSPRYDFCIPPWVDALDTPSGLTRPLILITSSFALSCPRFASSYEVEINNMMAVGYEKEYLLSRLKDDIAAREKLIEVITGLSADFPSADIVIRPHPFEDEKGYAGAFSGAGNVRIIREGTVGPWLKAASAILHLNSSVAIDAYMMGKVPISLDWINTDIIRGMSEISYDASYKSTSYDDLKKMIQRSIEEGCLPADKYSALETKKEVEAWFHLIDGQASRRVANSVLDTIRNRGQGPSEHSCRRMAMYGSRNPRSLSGWALGLGRCATGPRTYDFLRTWVLTKDIGTGKKRGKKVALEKVTKLLERLDKVDPEGDGIRKVRACAADGSVRVLKDR